VASASSVTAAAGDVLRVASGGGYYLPTPADSKLALAVQPAVLLVAAALAAADTTAWRVLAGGRLPPAKAHGSNLGAGWSRSNDGRSSEDGYLAQDFRAVLEPLAA
jgi:hypothetical protein